MEFSEDAIWLSDEALSAFRIVIISEDGLVILSKTLPTAAALELEATPLKLLLPERVTVRTRLLPEIAAENPTEGLSELIVAGIIFPAIPAPPVSMIVSAVLVGI